MVRISEFQVKDVVSISDGRKLGNIGDIEINLDTGKIEAIVIGGGGKILGFFGKEEDIVIPWSSIVKIGEDVILVRYKENHYIQGQLQEPKQSPDT
ncbi:MAG: YlmC/YmxH family sporulation protein [Bacillota bacterium]|uniref:YlmC/YmxH family sporulation protein n=1 Tax=Rossellomorea TaxID=2837508 RepID=UPI0005C86C4A|nr:YlmC/YmxH family sporulation protein [Rossellomorea aquimaris]